MSDHESHFRLRLPSAMHARIKEDAKREHRSLNAQIIYLLEKAMEGEKE